MKQTLRRLAVIGPLLVLGVELVRGHPWQERQEYALAVLVLTVVATGVVLRWLLPQETRRLREQLDLLVPLGLYILAQQLLAWAMLFPLLARILEPGWEISLFALSLTLSVSVVVMIALAAVFATWTLALICCAIQGRPVELLEGLEQIRRSFWRVLGYMAVSVVVFFLGISLAIALSTAAMPLGLLAVALGTLLLNFATAGILLRAVSKPEIPFWRGLREGLAASWRNKRRWWLPLAVQMEILGLVTYVGLSFADSGRHNTVSNWAVNGLWTGGFESDSRWASVVMDAVEVPAPEVVATLLAIVLGVLAVTIKLRVARGLHEAGEL